jgi:hypothetical protein
MIPSSTFTRLALGAFAFAALAGCDLQKLGNQAQARTVAVSTLLSTPRIEVKGAAVAGNGLDAGGLIPVDAGITLDAGVFVSDAGITIPAQNLAFVFFGQRQGDTLDSPPVGVEGAAAKLQRVGGASFALADEGSGAYALPADAGFTYESGATYQFEFGLMNQTYVAEVEDVPAREQIDEFDPPAGYVELEAGSPFAFHRPDPPPGRVRNFGFVNVFPVSSDGSQGAVTYTNIPSTALGFLKLVVAPGDWQKTRVEIPGSAFPERDRNYVIVLQSAKLGGPKSENLFTGSAILAGTADVLIVKTKP